MNLITKLPLSARLDINAEIESRNKEHTKTLWNWSCNPQGEAPDSDNESVITIPDEDLDRLLDPSTFNAFSASMPFFVREEVSSRKRQREADVLALPTESLADKRCCINDSYFDSEEDGPLIDTPISQLFYQTAKLKIFIPLHLFESLALSYINENEIIILNDSKTVNGTKILDVKQLTKALGGIDELHPSFNYVKFLGASDNYLRFQASCDITSDTGKWSKYWNLHFKFFTNQVDAADVYPHWKAHEHKLRMLLFKGQRRFDEQRYENAYMIAQSAYLNQKASAVTNFD